MAISRYIIFIIKLYSLIINVCMGDLALRQCDPIRIEMCRNIGYNKTSMPNLVGNELQSEAEYTLQTFTPLIEYVCSSQLKLFLCATYVPMCTPKVSAPIGPCRTLCESVRSRCNPVLQGFGYPWPPALDCNRFPKENNHETMCMEGPGEMQGSIYSELPAPNTQFPDRTVSNFFKCPGHSKFYVKLHRFGRCAQLCEANILFGPNEKHIAELWTHTWTYAALALALLAFVCLTFSGPRTSKQQDLHKTQVLSSMMWSHTLVSIGWTIRFVAGRNATSCGYDPQFPNVSLLLIDGLSNSVCASTFILRYYFGMAACAWWAILCLGWHRNVRRASFDELIQIPVDANGYPNVNNSKGATKIFPSNVSKIENSITSNHLARFVAWGLPAFQTTAVVVARLVDADELLGSCYVGNQSDKGLQILVATPLFCYWIFGSMNLSSGFLVYRRNKKILRNTNSTSFKYLLQKKCSISGVFLFIYCLPYAMLLLAVIYEYANIDLWLNQSPYNQTPSWPFLTRAFIELFLGIICFVSISVPKITAMYKRQLAGTAVKAHKSNTQFVLKYNAQNSSMSSRGSNKYQSVRGSKSSTSKHAKTRFNYKMSKNQMRKYDCGRSIPGQSYSHHLTTTLAPISGYTTNSLKVFEDETIL